MLGTRGIHRGIAAAVIAILFVAGLAASSAPAGGAETQAGGLVLRTSQQLTPRLSQLRVFSPAMDRELNVRVLTPAGFDATAEPLPVLWLLHGGFGSAPDWTTAGNAEALTAGLPMIVVMPDAGTGGWYADWRNATLEGPQNWETFHLAELRPFIEERYNTRTDRGGRAVAGLSMGGFGAIHYAARHPHLFGFAAAFSGAVDILHLGVSAVVSASPFAHQGLPPDLFGERLIHESRWRANNPVDLAANLRHVTVQLRTGNGTPGQYGGFFDPQEFGCWQASTTLHNRLTALGIPHVWSESAGSHTFDYWRDHLRATLPGVMARFNQATPDPETASHVAFEPSFSAWGHDVALARPVYESATLAVRPDGFDLTGTGSGTVTTPSRFAPGETVRATTASSTGTSAVDLVADGAGRLRVPVNLGAASLLDEYPLATLLPPAKSTVRVTLAPGASASASASARSLLTLSRTR